MLLLPDVTLVAVDSVAHQLTRLALEDALTVLIPARTIVWSDSAEALPDGAEFALHRGLASLADVARVLWHDVPERVTTSHFLIVQWDGWPVNASAWDNDFLIYDYIGAPWPWHNQLRVGNGGFSLRSTALMRAASRYDVDFDRAEDDALCRQFRPRLEYEGYRWAPESVAWRFAVEHGPWTEPFGFHDVANWPRALPREAVARRVTAANDYCRAKSGFSKVERWLEECSDV